MTDLTSAVSSSGPPRREVNERSIFSVSIGKRDR